MTIDFGISHGDDNFIMFHQKDPVESLKSDEDAAMSKKLVSMWTRFATYGKIKISVIKLTCVIVYRYLYLVL